MTGKASMRGAEKVGRAHGLTLRRGVARLASMASSSRFSARQFGYPNNCSTPESYLIAQLSATFGVTPQSSPEGPIEITRSSLTRSSEVGVYCCGHRTAQWGGRSPVNGESILNVPDPTLALRLDHWGGMISLPGC